MLTTAPTRGQEEASSFDTLPVEARSLFAEYAERWPELKPQILHAWAQLQTYPAEREQILGALAIWARNPLPTDARKVMAGGWEQIKSLPPAEHLKFVATVVHNARYQEYQANIRERDTYIRDAGRRTVMEPKPSGCQLCTPVLVRQ